MFILILFSFFLQSQDVIKYPETPPINNPELLQRFKQKEQPQLLDENYWDDDRILFSTYFGGSGYDCINDGVLIVKGILFKLVIQEVQIYQLLVMHSKKRKI